MELGPNLAEGSTRQVGGRPRPSPNCRTHGMSNDDDGDDNDDGDIDNLCIIMAYC